MRKVFQNSETKTTATSLFRRKHALGLPIHINMSLIYMNTDFYTIVLLSTTSTILIAF